MFRHYKIRNYSFILMGAVIALSIIGILIIGSAQNSSQIRQIYGLVIGGGLMLAAGALLLARKRRIEKKF
jgi:rod shape determining protein RodA